MKLDSIVKTALLGLSMGAMAACTAEIDEVDEESVDSAESAICVHPLDEAKAALPSALMVWPVSGTSTPDKIISPHGPRYLPNEGGYDFHPGIDLWPAGATSEPTNHPDIHAAAKARIHKREVTTTSGLSLTLKHRISESGSWTSQNNLYFTRYAHLEDLASFTDSAGTPVSKWSSSGDPLDAAGTVLTIELAVGQVIGHMGNSGASVNELHFELRGHNQQFYAINPLKLLPRTQNDDYAPEILTQIAGTSCNTAYNPSSPMFWVKYRASTSEIDVTKVALTVTNVCNANQSPVTKTMDINRKEGIAIYSDKNADCSIDGTANSYTEYTTTPTKEYYANHLQTGITPTFDQCGQLRNHFNWNNAEYSMEVKFDALGISGTGLRVDAAVTDIDGHTIPANPIMPCANDQECRVIRNYNTCTCTPGAACQPESQGSPESCENDPCANTSAVCNAGACTLVQ